MPKRVKTIALSLLLMVLSIGVIPSVIHAQDYLLLGTYIGTLSIPKHPETGRSEAVKYKLEIRKDNLFLWGFFYEWEIEQEDKVPPRVIAAPIWYKAAFGEKYAVPPMFKVFIEGDTLKDIDTDEIFTKAAGAHLITSIRWNKPIISPKGSYYEMKESKLWSKYAGPGGRVIEFFNDRTGFAGTLGKYEFMGNLLKLRSEIMGEKLSMEGRIEGNVIVIQESKMSITLVRQKADGVTNIKDIEVAPPLHYGLPVLRFPLSGNLKEKIRERLIQKYYGFGSDWTAGSKCANKWKKHIGVDWPAKPEEPIYAVEDGVVKDIGIVKSDKNWGERIVIHHKDSSVEFTSMYFHVSPDEALEEKFKEAKKKGQEVTVKKGERIGTIADISPEPDHLHFQIRVGTYNKDLCKIGALPQKTTSEPKCGYPIFPEKFIDPETLTYEPILPSVKVNKKEYKEKYKDKKTGKVLADIDVCQLIIEWPQDKKLEAKINSEIEETGSEWIKDFKETKKRGTEYEFHQSCKGSVEYNSYGLLSIFQIYYEEGVGPHPNGWFEALNVDLKNGRKLLIRDFYKDSEDWEAVVKQSIYKDMLAEPESYFEEVIQNWQAEPIDPEQSFYIYDDNSIVVFFQSGELAPLLGGMGGPRDFRVAVSKKPSEIKASGRSLTK